ncbi:MAG: UDP-N-acetylmuramoyl-tripeptide--D-alanyl-D-alanine ligase [Clostridia bacterium]|nr:UDP-N-acetylmuramoyl-tripeptide--D-alanyl-D-alanine ligase [Clostridia bacterium]
MRIRLSVSIPAPTRSGGIIEYICTDSREVMPRDLFFSLASDKDAGALHIAEALARGAILPTSLSLCDTDQTEPHPDLWALCREYMKRLCRLRQVVAVTGSVGKSTTTTLLANILSRHVITHSTHGNYNNAIGTPLSVLMAPADTEVLVLELGMNHKGEIGALSRLIRPTAAIITNIGTAHIGNLGSRSAIAEAKSEICNGMDGGYVICPHAEPYLSKIKNKLSLSVGDGGDFQLTVHSADRYGSSFSLCSRFGNIENASLNIGGEHILYCAALALSAAMLLGIPADELRRDAELLSEAPLRRSFTDLPGFTVFDDSYNASYESLAADLFFMDKHRPRPLGALIGDMLELGDDAEAIHRRIGILLAEHKMDSLYLFGEYAEVVKSGAVSHGLARKNIHIVPQAGYPHICAELIEKYHKENELILFKASHMINLGEVLELLKSREIEK